MSDPYRIRNFQICTKGVNLTSLGCILDRLEEDGADRAELDCVKNIAAELLKMLRRINAGVNEGQPIRSHERVTCPRCEEETLSQGGEICRKITCNYRGEQS